MLRLARTVCACVQVYRNAGARAAADYLSGAGSGGPQGADWEAPILRTGET